MISVELLTKQNESEWNNFTEKYIGNEYSFTLQWRNILRDAFAYENFYYLIRENNNLKGIFPLYLVKSKILKNRFISIPFTDTGGFYFNADLSEDKKLQAFYQIEENLSFFKKIPLELRGPETSSNNFLIKKNIFNKINPYVKFIISLDTSWENIEKKLSRNIKRNLNVSSRKIEINLCQDKRLLKPIYKLYLKEMKKFGSPPLPFSFWEKLWDELKASPKVLIFSASYHNKIIGAITLISYKQTLYADLIMSEAKYNHLFPKQHLYLASLKYAWQNKQYKYYDFNRTRKNSGVLEHKQKWGGIIEEIFYFCQNGQNYFFDPEQKRFSLLRKTLKHTPLYLLRTLGKTLRKQTGK